MMALLEQRRKLNEAEELRKSDPNYKSDLLRGMEAAASASSAGLGALAKSFEAGASAIAAGLANMGQS
jgi:hypothetical protein